ncbi:MAG TPA: hypothetical protein VK463_03205 [Desulfomonilaceae bacterium]|nr:hypothetical protein [Desulfomonilaceae bacterium]
MKTIDESMDVDSVSRDDLAWARDRQVELSQRGCALAVEDDMCACEDPQSATEFFLMGPRDVGCECESC